MKKSLTLIALLIMLLLYIIVAAPTYVVILISKYLNKLLSLIEHHVFKYTATL
jgi:hypothetical protein